SHRRECLGKDFVEDVADGVAQLSLEATGSVRTAQLIVDALAVAGIDRDLLGLLQGRDLCGQLGRPLANRLAEFRGLRLELRLTDGLQSLPDFVDFVDDRLDPLPLAIVPRAEHRPNQALQHSVMNSVTGTAADPRCKRPPARARTREWTVPRPRAPVSPSTRRPRASCRSPCPRIPLRGSQPCSARPARRARPPAPGPATAAGLPPRQIQGARQGPDPRRSSSARAAPEAYQQ